MAQLYSAAEAARQIGCDKSTVTRHCARYGVGQRIGGRLILSQADIRRLSKVVRPTRGNPNFGSPKHPEKKS